MIYAVTTKTGAIYVIDKDANEWFKIRRNSQTLIDITSEHYYLEHRPTTLVELKSGTEMCYPYEFTDETWGDVEIPVVGKYMYISGHRPNEWMVATKVQKVEVLDKIDLEDLTGAWLTGTAIEVSA